MTNPHPITQTLLLGERLNPTAILDGLSDVFPLIMQMAKTPQDPEWHAEGNVRIHTEWVLAEMIGLLETGEFGQIPAVDATTLILAAALHDVGKPLTTREQELDGKVRIVSPHHAARGYSYVALRVGLLGLAPDQETRLLGLIAHHHDPQKLVRRDAKVHYYRKLARCVSPKWIVLLETADLRGRDCGSDTEAEDWLAMFQMACEDYGVFDIDDPYADWRSEIRCDLTSASPETIAYVEAEAIRQHEAGEIHTPCEAIARTYAHRENFARVTITCGPSGSGKSHWLAANRPNITRVSLDEIREELCGKRDDQSKNGQVMQLAKERLRAALRTKQAVIWEATNLREDGRAGILQLAYDYHALTEILAFNTPPALLEQRNAKRKHPIPSSVMRRQWDGLQWPEPTEAHTVSTIRTL